MADLLDSLRLVNESLCVKLQSNGHYLCFNGVVDLFTMNIITHSVKCWLGTLHREFNNAKTLMHC